MKGNLVSRMFGVHVEKQWGRGAMVFCAKKSKVDLLSDFFLYYINFFPPKPHFNEEKALSKIKRVLDFYY